MWTKYISVNVLFTWLGTLLVLSITGTGILQAGMIYWTGSYISDRCFGNGVFETRYLLIWLSNDPSSTSIGTVLHCKLQHKTIRYFYLNKCSCMQSLVETIIWTMPYCYLIRNKLKLYFVREECIRFLCVNGPSTFTLPYDMLIWMCTSLY